MLQKSRVSKPKEATGQAAGPIILPLPSLPGMGIISRAAPGLLPKGSANPHAMH